MERRIKDSHLRNTRDQVLHSVDTFQVGGVMQRSQIRTLNNLVEHLLVDQHAAGEFLAAMHHAMTNGVDLLIILDTTVSRVSQDTQDKLDTLLMTGDILLEDHLLAILVRQFQESAGQADLLDSTLGHHVARSHIKQFVLDRATTAIQY